MIVTTKEELEILREGGKRLAYMLDELKSMVAPGVSTGTLEEMARALIAARGDTPAFLGYTPAGSGRPFPAALCVSINEVIVHGIPNEKPRNIKEGDVVTLDLGLIHEGLIVDAAVSTIAGAGSEEDLRLVRAVYEALDASISRARTGNTTGDIGRAVQAVGEKHDLKSPRELGGHGVGKSVHEEPFVPNWGKPGTGVKLKEGQVLAIEPMFAIGSAEVKLLEDGYTYVTKDGSRTAQVEHTVVVGKDGAEVLTKT